MGEVLNYRRGMAAMSLPLGKRHVRIMGHMSWKQHGMPAILHGCTPRCAIVRPKGHKSNIEIEWRYVYDAPSRNGGPWPSAPPEDMPVITRVPEPTAQELAELRKAYPVQPPPPVSPRHVATPAGTPAAKSIPPTIVPVTALADLRAAVAESDAVDMGELPGRIRKAIADLEAAKGIRRDMQAEQARQLAAAELEIKSKEDALRALRKVAFDLIGNLMTAADTTLEGKS